ncbi:DUF2971 domain-containing protein [Spirosoma sp. SC4-14]|uniref:DUF2971 domain-containing protein n=1 Tax=Spirosoma sp. SC4-14 TaxID=3128900 RepID=UPI0030D33B4F
MKSWDDFHTESGETDDLEILKTFLPEMCYKYRIWEKSFHPEILTKQELYFSAPLTDFEDPDDCRYPVVFDFSPETLEKNYLYQSRLAGSTLSDAQLKSVAKYLYEERFSTPDKQQARKNQFYELFNQHHGVFCFCKSATEEPMWKGYAADFKGFCVGISMRDCLELLPWAGILGGDVTYVDKDFPGLEYIWEIQQKYKELPLFILRLLTTKYREWKHEKEYRFVKSIKDAHNRAITKEDRTFIVPKHCYKEVIFGNQMSEESKAEIFSACSTQGLQIEFKVASPSSLGMVNIENYK